MTAAVEAPSRQGAPVGAARRPVDAPRWVVSDRAAVAVAVAVAVGAHVGGGPPLVAGALGVALAVAVRRWWVLAVALALVAATLSDRAQAGLEPVAPGMVEAAWVRVASDPEPVAGGVRADVVLDGRRLEASARGAAAGGLAERLTGERVLVSGRLRPPPDGAPWLEARRVVGRLEVAEVTASDRGGVAARAANAVRRTIDRGAEGLDQGSRALLTGVVLGDDRDLPPELADDFQAAGLVHLTAVSGANVAFVLFLAGPVLRRLRWRSRLPATVAVIVAFAFLTRFEPSVVRASTMAGIAALAAALGRPTAGIRILALAVGGLVLVDPLLVRSVGFGLSVAASAGILVLSGPIERRVPGPRPLAAAVGVTVAAQIGVTPLLIPIFGSLPVASVPANVLAGPAAGALMCWGLPAGILAGLLGPGPAAVLHAPTRALTGWLEVVSARTAELELGEIGPGHAVALAALVGVGLGWGWWRRRRPVPGGRGVAVVLVAAASVVVAAPAWAVRHPPAAHEGREVAPGVVLHRAGAASVVVVDGPVGAARLLESLRVAGVRCPALVVSGGGALAGAAVGPLTRRCPATVAAGPTDRAPPGWVGLAPGEALAVGGLAGGLDAAGDPQAGPRSDR